VAGIQTHRADLLVKVPLTAYARDAPTTTTRNIKWSERNCCGVLTEVRKGLKTPYIKPPAKMVSHGTASVAMTICPTYASVRFIILGLLHQPWYAGVRGGPRKSGFYVR